MSSRLRGARAGVPTLGALCLSAALAACTNTPNRAPVEDRVATNRQPPAAVPQTAPGAAATDIPKPLPGAENAGKPGYYTVKGGDTLIRIALENGQNWRDVVRWNGLDNPNVIEVGQVLRVVPPGVDPNAVATRPIAAGRLDSRPLDARPLPATGPAPAASAPLALPPVAVAAASAPPPTVLPSVAVLAPAPKDGDDDINWAWPTTDAVKSGFDDAKGSKGLVFAGKAGDPVTAAADGRVVYAGSGLRGYGNLIILKHNNTYLTAYAHNQALLVKEDQTVRRGQKIAEMGSTDADAVQLHFEIRRQGKPVDPARLLPAR